MRESENYAENISFLMVKMRWVESRIPIPLAVDNKREREKRKKH